MRAGSENIQILTAILKLSKQVLNYEIITDNFTLSTRC